ncbi:VOC family protein [Candidatus Bathyarchaeota archaeon]|nr:VOC family protein [Candidatus Bathyarchaeota archaeon]
MSMKSKFMYVGIRVTDLERSIDFYTNILGMKISGRSKIEQTKGETVGLQTEKDGFTLELNHYEKDSPYNTKYVVGEGLDHLAFKVDDLDKALEEAKKAGHRTILQMKADGGRWAYIEDPDGNWIELF